MKNWPVNQEDITIIHRRIHFKRASKYINIERIGKKRNRKFKNNSGILECPTFYNG